jgi:hypothetical protein
MRSLLWFAFTHVRLSIEERKRRCMAGVRVLVSQPQTNSTSNGTIYWPALLARPLIEISRNLGIASYPIFALWNYPVYMFAS